MIHAIASVLLAGAILIVPGLLLARLGGVRGWGAASAALPLSCAVIGTGVDGLDDGGGDVDPDDLMTFVGVLDRQGQPDLAQGDDGDAHTGPFKTAGSWRHRMPLECF